MEHVHQALYYLSWVLLTGGGLLCIIGAIGLLRFPDMFTRMHAAGVIDTGGAALILIGLMLQTGWTLDTVKLLFILLFLLFTSPTASYALARGAISDGHRPEEAEIKVDDPEVQPQDSADGVGRQKDA